MLLTCIGNRRKKRQMKKVVLFGKYNAQVPQATPRQPFLEGGRITVNRASPCRLFSLITCRPYSQTTRTRKLCRSMRAQFKTSATDKWRNPSMEAMNRLVIRGSWRMTQTLRRLNMKWVTHLRPWLGSNSSKRLRRSIRTILTSSQNQLCCPSWPRRASQNHHRRLNIVTTSKTYS